MGYDSRLFIIRKTDFPVDIENKFKYAETMAVYEMGVFYPFQMLFNENCPITEHAPFAPGGGDREVIKDCYGDPLRERTLTEVIDCLDQYIAAHKDGELYARVKPLRALLQEFEKIQNDRYHLAVLHFGH